MSDPIDDGVTWIEVTDEQVDAARLHVEAYRSAGLEPDPIAVEMADAAPLTDPTETTEEGQ